MSGGASILRLHHDVIVEVITTAKGEEKARHARHHLGHKVEVVDGGKLTELHTVQHKVCDTASVWIPYSDNLASGVTGTALAVGFSPIIGAASQATLVAKAGEEERGDRGGELGGGVGNCLML